MSEGTPKPLVERGRLIHPEPRADHRKVPRLAVFMAPLLIIAACTGRPTPTTLKAPDITLPSLFDPTFVSNGDATTLEPKTAQPASASPSVIAPRSEDTAGPSASQTSFQEDDAMTATPIPSRSAAPGGTSK